MMEDKDGIAAEPFELMQYFYRRSHDPLIRCKIDLVSHIDAAVLKRAVEVSTVAAPLILCAFDKESGPWVNQQCDASDVVNVVNGDDSVSVESELLRPLDQHAGPRLRISVMRGLEKDSLCVIADHMICDGAGFKEYLYLLAGIYSALEGGADGCDLVGHYPTRRDFGQVSENVELIRKLRIMIAGTNTPPADPAMHLPLSGDDGEARLAHMSIDPAVFARIRAYAKFRKATVNDMLLTAYARALHNVTGCFGIVLPCPVDLRRYGKAGQRFGFCNLTSNYLCHLEMRRDEPFDETLGAVSLQMKAQKVNEACLKGPLLFHALARVASRRRLEEAFFKTAGVPVVSFTNLGVIDEGRLAFGTIRPENASAATALKRPPSFQLSASTFRGTCTMTSSLYANDSDFQFIESFLKDVKDELVSAQQMIPKEVTLYAAEMNGNPSYEGSSS